MSTDLVHVMTVIGNGARQVEAACESLLERRVESEVGSFGSDDWTQSDQWLIETFCRSAIRAARALPVVYYAQYLDAWTVANSRYHWIDWPDGRRRQIAGQWFGVAWYPSAFEAGVLGQIAKFKRRKAYRTQAEDRWFVDHVDEAIRVGRGTECPYVVLTISEHLGPGRSDDEVLASTASDIELQIGEPGRQDAPE